MIHRVMALQPGIKLSSIPAADSGQILDPPWRQCSSSPATDAFIVFFCGKGSTHTYVALRIILLLDQVYGMLIKPK